MRASLSTILVVLLVAACGGKGSNGDDVQTPQCSDGIDNDGDGMADFPDDLGCTSATDDSEDSPASAQCADGRDNDGDGLADYPADPGCTAPQQDDETDDCPDGPNCPECGNHKDDDGNGSIDFPNDPGCTSASDLSERVDNPVACGAGLVIKQLPTTNTDDGMLDGSSLSQIASPCGGGQGSPAVAYQVFLSKPKVLQVTTDDGNTTANTVIDIRKADCSADSAEIACNDDAVGATVPGASKVTASLQAGNYYVIVSARDSASGGAYTVAVKFFSGEGTACSMPAECGPGLVCRVPMGGTTKSCQQPMCKDGVDDDGDGKADYPTDPGCTTPDDNDETDTCPGAHAGCPECGDGVDNDGDGKTDYGTNGDTTCLSAGDVSEACTSTDGVGLITTGTLSDTTVGAHNDVVASCGSSTSNAGDKTYRLDLPALSELTITNSPSNFADLTQSLLPATCGGTPLDCEDFSNIHLTNLAAGAYYYVVDGYFDTTDEDAFTSMFSGKIAAHGSCEGALAQSGALICGTGYACKGTMGSRTCEPGLCGDGIDNDGDGKIDFPFDPGCDSLADDTEADPATPPVCSDNIDNDGDSTKDFPADYGCASAAGTTEAFCTAETNPTELITAKSTAGTTVGLTNNFATQSCQSTSTGPDKVYAISLPVPVQSLTLDLSSATFDSVVEMRDTTCATTVGCDDDGGGFPHSKLTVSNVMPGNYAVIVDGYSGAAGTYTLVTTGTVAAGTSCTSPLFSGGANAILTCAAPTTCTGSPLKCQ